MDRRCKSGQSAVVAIRATMTEGVRARVKGLCSTCCVMYPAIIGGSGPTTGPIGCSEPHRKASGPARSKLVVPITQVD